MCGDRSGSSRDARPLRVCLVGSAANIHVQQWAMWLAGNGYEVDVLSNYPGDIEGVRVWHLPSKQRYGNRAYLLSLPMVWKTVRAIRPSVVHIHYLGGSMLYVPLLPKRLPLILSAWGSDILRAGRGHRLILKAFLTRASLVLTTSRQMADTLRRSYGVEALKVRTVSWGISAEAVKLLDETRRTAVRGQMGVSDDMFVVLCNRLMTPVYDTETVLEGFAKFHSEHGRSWLFLIEGPDTEDAIVLRYRRELHKKAQAAECVSVLPGRISQQDMLGLLRASDAVVSIPLTDQRSSSALEALSQCSTVICSDIPPNRELQEEGFGLALVRPRCSIELAKALLFASSEAKQAAEQRLEHNRLLIVDHETSDAQMRIIASEYVRLVRGA